MSLIYTPKGKAREYSPLALNVYSGGCDHGCKYCYCSNIMRGAWLSTPKPRNLSSLSLEAKQASEQVLLCFMSDPYCKAETDYRQTRKALHVLLESRCSVAILTKGGKRCLDDLNLFKAWPEKRIKVGATLTFISDSRSLNEEPGAALPQDRLDTLRILHEHGLKTWASIEPVIDPVESLAIIKASLPFVDAYKVGKLNHSKNNTDWRSFGLDAVDMIRASGKELYVKHDLQQFIPGGYLTAQEKDMNNLNLPTRKDSQVYML